MRTLFAALLMASVAGGCGDSPGQEAARDSASPSAPSFVSLPPTSITINGVTSLSVPGETTQLHALATFLDGSRRDLTDSVGWAVCSASQNGTCARCLYKVVDIDANGAALAVAYGRTNVMVVYPRGAAGNTPGAVHGWTPFRVVPDGMAVLTGRVTAEGNGLAGAVLEVEASTATLRGVTGPDGGFMLAPLAGEVHVRASREGFGPATLVVRLDHDEDVELELAPVAVASRPTAMR